MLGTILVITRTILYIKNNKLLTNIYKVHGGWSAAGVKPQGNDQEVVARSGAPGPAPTGRVAVRAGDRGGRSRGKATEGIRGRQRREADLSPQSSRGAADRSGSCRPLRAEPSEPWGQAKWLPGPRRAAPAAPPSGGRHRRVQAAHWRGAVPPRSAAAPGWGRHRKGSSSNVSRAGLVLN